MHRSDTSLEGKCPSLFDSYSAVAMVLRSVVILQDPVAHPSSVLQVGGGKEATWLCNWWHVQQSTCCRLIQTVCKLLLVWPGRVLLAAPAPQTPASVNPVFPSLPGCIQMGVLLLRYHLPGSKNPVVGAFLLFWLIRHRLGRGCLRRAISPQVQYLTPCAVLCCPVVQVAVSSWLSGIQRPTRWLTTLKFCFLWLSNTIQIFPS